MPASLPPANAGNLFVADLATGLSVAITVPNTTPVRPSAFPSGSRIITVDNTTGVPSFTVTPVGTQLGGRIVRITALGVVSNFAENFDTVNTLGSNGFAESSLSISFSADGTTLYAADDAGIWQFKTVASLAGSTSGSLIGLNDLRSLGVPYDGEGEAVAVIDTGVDALDRQLPRSRRGRHERHHERVRQSGHRAQSVTTANGTTAGGTGTAARPAGPTDRHESRLRFRARRRRPRHTGRGRGRAVRAPGHARAGQHLRAVPHRHQRDHDHDGRDRRRRHWHQRQHRKRSPPTRIP